MTVILILQNLTLTSIFFVHKGFNAWTYLKEIPNTSLLVSIQQNESTAAKMKIFNISTKGRARTNYSFEEVQGGNNIF